MVQAILLQAETYTSTYIRCMPTLHYARQNSALNVQWWLNPADFTHFSLQSSVWMYSRSSSSHAWTNSTQLGCRGSLSCIRTSCNFSCLQIEYQLENVIFMQYTNMGATIIIVIHVLCQLSLKQHWPVWRADKSLFWYLDCIELSISLTPNLVHLQCYKPETREIRVLSKRFTVLMIRKRMRLMESFTYIRIRTTPYQAVVRPNLLKALVQVFGAILCIVMTIVKHYRQVKV